MAAQQPPVDALGKVVQNRIMGFEKQMQLAQSDLAQYTHKHESLRNILLLTRDHIQTQATAEPPRLKKELQSVGETLNKVSQEYDNMVKRGNTQTVDIMKKFPNDSIQLKQTCKMDITAFEKKDRLEKQLQKLNAQLIKDRARITQVTFELAGATKAAKTSKDELTKQTKEYERQRAADVRGMFLNFAHTHIQYHARCLEIYTEMFNNISMEEDEEEFEAEEGEDEFDDEEEDGEGEGEEEEEEEEEEEQDERPAKGQRASGSSSSGNGGNSRPQSAAAGGARSSEASASARR